MLEQGCAVGILVQRHIARAEHPEEGVIVGGVRHRAGAAVHLRGDRGLIGLAEHVSQLDQRGDAELEQDVGDPAVVLGTRPAGLRVLPGEVRRQLARVEPRIVSDRLVDFGCHAPESLSDLGELVVSQFEQPGGEGETAVELADVLGRHGSFVADVVLELGPRMLQHRAHLDLGRVPAQVGEVGMALPGPDPGRSSGAGWRSRSDLVQVLAQVLESPPARSPVRRGHRHGVDAATGT